MKEWPYSCPWKEGMGLHQAMSIMLALMDLLCRDGRLDQALNVAE